MQRFYIPVFIMLFMLFTKALFIGPVLKTEWQICGSIISECPPNWSGRKLLMCRSVTYKNGKSAVFKTGK